MKRKEREIHWHHLLDGITRGALILVCAVNVTGCVSSYTLKVPPDDKTEILVERLAGTVGVYYPPEFRNYVGSATPISLLAIQAPLGESSIATFDRTLQALFQDVVPISEWPIVRPLDRQLDLVVVPRIEGFVASLRLEPRYQSSVSIRYALSLHSPVGNELAQFRLDGTASTRRLIMTSKTSWESMIGASIRNASAHLATGLPAHPAVAGRLTPLPDSRQPAQSPATVPQDTGGRTTLTVLPPHTPDEIGGAECLVRALEESYQYVSFMPDVTFRSTLFPWLEPGVEPEHGEPLTKLLKRPLVARRLSELGVRYLLSPMLITSAPGLSGPFMCGGGMGAAGCFGVATAERRSTMTVKVWDLTTGNAMATPYFAESKGTSWAAGFVIPVWRTAPTEDEACRGVIKQMAGILAR